MTVLSAGPVLTIISRLNKDVNSTLDVLKAWVISKGFQSQAALFKGEGTMSKLKEIPLCACRSAINTEFGQMLDKPFKYVPNLVPHWPCMGSNSCWAISVEGVVFCWSGLNQEGEMEVYFNSGHKLFTGFQGEQVRSFLNKCDLEIGSTTLYRCVLKAKVPDRTNKVLGRGLAPKGKGKGKSG